jgi:hypothetical protein
MTAAASTIAPALTPTPRSRAPRPTGHPTIEAPQHMRALQKANQVRLARAALKREISSGSKTALEVVLDCPSEAESMPISELLAAQRRWGRTRSRKLLSCLELKENKAIGTLTERQRRLLAQHLGYRP